MALKCQSWKLNPRDMSKMIRVNDRISKSLIKQYLRIKSRLKLDSRHTNLYFVL